MKAYVFKDEHGNLELQAAANNLGIVTIEEHFKKSIEEINKELEENNCIISNNKKFYMSIIFLDFLKESELL